jgi:hypothetical protein
VVRRAVTEVFNPDAVFRGGFGDCMIHDSTSFLLNA